MPDVDFLDFHRVTLPSLLAAGNGVLATPITHRLPSITFSVEGHAFTYVPVDAGVDVVEGTVEGAASVELAAAAWSSYVQEMQTAFGLAYAGAVEGRVDVLMAWEPAVRAMFHGRAPYDPAIVELFETDLEDAAAGFTLDHLDTIGDFARRVGVVLVRGVFSPEEIEGFRAEVDRLQDLARPGDDRSWWAGGETGEDLCCRLTFVNERSALLADIHEDPRIVALVDAVRPPGAQLSAQTDRHDGHAVVIKVPRTTSGLADLPWHVDCGLGGHPVLCPGLNIGIQLEAATPQAGQLRFLAGSHRFTAMHLTPAQLESAHMPQIAVATEPGDVTIHFTDTLHVAPPPAGEGGRRVLYVSYTNVAALDVVQPGQGYNDVVLRSGEGNRVENLARG